MSLINLLLVLMVSTIITGNPIADNEGHQSAEGDPSQWSSVPEVDESSMMQMLNSIMEMIRSQLSGWMFGSRSNDDVEVDSSNRGFVSMIHGLFSRLSNMAMDMMGQMRRMRDKSTKDRLQESSSSETDSTTGTTNSSTLATRLRNQMENTRDRIKDAWNNLMKKYNSTIGSSSSSAMTMESNSNGDSFHLIDDQSKANRNLRSDNRRVIRSVENENDDQVEVSKLDYINSVEPKVFDKLISIVDQVSSKSYHQGKSKKFDSLIAPQSDEDPGQSRNLFDRMRGAMDNARSKFFGAINKFMNGTVMNDSDDDSTNLTENDPKNWWQMFKPKPVNPTRIPEREPLTPRSAYPTKSNYPPTPMFPREIPTIKHNRPDYLPSHKPPVDWTIRSHPKTIPTESKVDLNNGDTDEPSRTTIEFMDRFKDEIERVKSSMDQSKNDNLEMAMAKMANWGLFIRSISESKNLDDFWGKITQQVN